MESIQSGEFARSNCDSSQAQDLQLEGQDTRQNKGASATEQVRETNKRKEGGIRGQLYELKLLMLFFGRGQLKEFNFSLGKQVAAAQKFDDIVFRFEVDGNYTYRFLQIKHVIDESRVISYKNLIAKCDRNSPDTLDKYFNLQKYFVSYCEMKNDPKFQDGLLENVVIFTNLNLNVVDLKANNVTAQQVATDKMFDIQMSTPKTAMFFKLQVEKGHEIFTLLKATSAQHRLAKELVAHTFTDDENNRAFRIDENSIFKYYQDALHKEIIDIDKNKFKTNFINDEGLSAEASNLRKMFLNEGLLYKKLSLTQDDIFWEELETKNLLFTKRFKILPKNKTALQQKLPLGTVTDNQIEDFFNHLIFAVNQPNEDKLSNLVINDDLQQSFKLENVEFFELQLKREIQDWLSKNNNGEDWISSDASKSLFDKAKLLIKSLIVAGMSFHFKSKINEVCGRKIKLTDVSLKNLKDAIEKLQVLHVCVDSKDNLLTMIKVIQIINESPEFQKEDAHTFIDLDSLLTHKDIVIETFKKGKNNLLILQVKEQKSSSENITKIFKQLEEILTNKNKKLIIIASKNDLLSEKFNNKQIYADIINFNDLASESQNMVLSKTVTFQGTKMSLSDLVTDSNTTERKSNSKTLRTKFNLNSDSILELLTDDEIIIDIAPPSLSDSEAAYATVNKNISPSIFQDVLLNEQSTHFIYMISGFEQLADGVSDLLINCLKINERNDQEKILNDIENKRIVITSNNHKENVGIFKKLCKDNPNKSVYWVEIMQKKIYWHQLYAHNFYIERKINTKKIVLNPEIEKQFVLYVEETDLFIIYFISDKTKLLNDLKSTNILTISEDEERQFNASSNNLRGKLSNSSSEDIFKYLTKTLMTIHWLKKETGQLIWNKSHGSLFGLREFVDQVKSKIEPLTENEFAKLSKSKWVIIADEPGMGKSTTLAKLFEYKIKTNWVININLRQCQQFIQTVKFDNSEEDIVECFVEFLLKLVQPRLHKYFVKNLLKMSLKNGNYTCRPLLLVFDGLDEVNEEKARRNLISLFEFLKASTLCEIWITTRLHYKKYLEDNLAEFAVDFERIPNLSQLNYLKKHWQARLKLEFNSNDLHSVFSSTLNKQELINRFAKFSTSLLNFANALFKGTWSSLFGIPLQLRLLAEYFQGDFASFIKNNNEADFNSKILDVKDLYQSFIKKKYFIYFSRQVSFGDFDLFLKEIFEFHFTKIYRREALRLVFPTFAKEWFSTQLQTETAETLARIGVTQNVNEKISFIHQTFAEYFIADFIVNRLLKTERRNLNLGQCSNLLNCVLNNPACQVIRVFINSHMGSSQFGRQNLKQGNSSWTNCARQISEMWSSNQDMFYNERHQTALHVAVAENQLNIINFMLVCFESQPLGLIDFISARNDENETALYLAAKQNKMEVVDSMLVKVKECDEEIKTNFLVASMFRSTEDEHDVVLTERLKESVQSYQEFVKIVQSINNKIYLTGHYLNIANNSFYQIKKQLNKEKDALYNRCLVMATNKEYKTIMQLAAENGFWNIVKFIIEWMEKQNLQNEIKFLINPTIRLMKPIFHLAAEQGKIDILELLIEFGAPVNVCDCTGKTALHYSIFSGKFKVTTFLVNEMADVNIRDNSGRTTLHYAAQHSQLETVELLLKNESDVNASDNFKFTALHIAAEKGNYSMIKQLISSGAQVNNCDYFGRNALHYCAMMGHLQVAQLLLNKKSDVNSADKDGLTPLHFAAMKLQFDMIKLLIKNNANIEASNINNDKAIYYFVANNEIDSVKWLLRKGAKVTGQDIHGFTALHAAAKIGNMDLVKLIIDNNADVNAKNKNNETPILLAASRGHLEIVHYLLDKGAACNYPNLSFETPLHLAVVNGHNDIAKLLIEINADIQAKNVLSQTAMFLAASTNQSEIMELLLEKGASVDVCDISGFTLLHLMAKTDNVNVLKRLTAEGVNVNAKTLFGETALHCCIKYACNFQVIEQLFESDADVEAVNLFYITALHLAAERGDLKVVQLLRTRKANVNAKDFLGRTVLHRAAAKGHLEIVKCLLQEGADIDAIDVNGTTTLHFAAGNESMITMRVTNTNTILSGCKSSVEVSASDDENNRLEIVKIILRIDKNANVKVTDHLGRTALHFAARGQLKVVKHLLENGADVNATDTTGKTVIQYAISPYIQKEPSAQAVEKTSKMNPIDLSEQNFKIASLLLEYGADVTTNKTVGRDVLHWAVHEGNEEIIKSLINKKVDINERDNLGNSAIHKATRAANLRVVKLLISNGANVNIKNNDNLTALDFAVDELNVMQTKLVANMTVLEGQLMPQFTIARDPGLLSAYPIATTLFEIHKLLIENGATFTAHKQLQIEFRFPAINIPS